MARQIPSAINVDTVILLSSKLPQLDTPLANLGFLAHLGFDLILSLQLESCQVLFLL